MLELPVVVDLPGRDLFAFPITVPAESTGGVERLLTREHLSSPVVVFVPSRLDVVAGDRTARNMHGFFLSRHIVPLFRNPARGRKQHQAIRRKQYRRLRQLWHDDCKNACSLLP